MAKSAEKILVLLNNKSIESPLLIPHLFNASQEILLVIEKFSKVSKNHIPCGNKATLTEEHNKLTENHVKKPNNLEDF